MPLLKVEVPLPVSTSFEYIVLNCFHYSLKVGVGMSMEGIEQNPVVYDLMSEMAFQHNKIDVKVSSNSFPKPRMPTILFN